MNSLTASMTDLATLAVTQFRQRQAYAQAQVDAGKWSKREATDRLRPWLALAAYFHSDLPELWEEGEDYAAIFVRGKPWPETIRTRRLPDDICHPADMREAVAAARDTAVHRTGAQGATDEDGAQALALVHLAIAIGARPFVPPASAPVAAGGSAIGHGQPPSSSRQAVGQTRHAA